MTERDCRMNRSWLSMFVATASLGIAACGSSDDRGRADGDSLGQNSAPLDDSPADGSALDPSGRFRYAGAFADDGEKAAFLTTLGTAAAFLAHWEALGDPISQAPLRVFVEPPPSVPWHDRLVDYFGPGIDAALEQARGAMQDAASGAGFDAIAASFYCDHPVLVNLSPGFPETAIAHFNSDPAAQRRAWIAQLDRVAHDPNVTEGLDHSSDFGFIPWRPACSAVNVGRSRQWAVPPDDRLDSAHDPSILLHELGHAVSLDTWTLRDPRSVLYYSGTVGEAVADIYAAAYLRSPCIGPSLAAEGAGGCLRRLDTGGETVSNAMLVGFEDPHLAGQGLRHVFWNLFEESPADFDRVFAAAVDAVAPILSHPADWRGRDPGEFPLVGVGGMDGFVQFPDAFLGFAFAYTSAYDASAGMVAAACAGQRSSRACAAAPESLGRYDAATVATLIANAPSTLGAAGTDLTVGGAPSHLRFESPHDGAGRVWTAVVTDHDGAERTFTFDADRDFGAGRAPRTCRYTLHARGSRAVAGSWSSDGRLDLAAPSDHR